MKISSLKSSRISIPTDRIFSFKGLLFTLIILYLVPKELFELPGIGLDPSWRLAINLALKEKLTWGKEIVFTFGPLGYLYTHLSLHASKLAIVLFALFINLNGIYFVYYLFRTVQSKKDLVVVAAILFFLGYFLFRPDSITLYLYFTFHAFHFLKHKNAVSLLIASVSALLAFYLKANTGIILNVLFVVFIAYNYIFRGFHHVKNAAYLAGHFIILWVLSLLLNTDILSYFQSSLPVVNAYNDAMVVIIQDKFMVYSAVVIFIIIVLVLLLSLKEIVFSLDELYLFSSLLLLFYVLFKQAFVRADHINIYFSGFTFIVITGYLFTRVQKIRSSLFLVAIATSFISVANMSGTPGKNVDEQIGFHFFVSGNELEMSEKALRRTLPPGIINEIGDHSVDVLGSEISFIFYNDLKYNPRPVIQSYLAYDPKLIDRNFDKYMSASGPEYVLYHLGSIDDRHPFWDEPKTYLSLLANYSLVDTIASTEYFRAMILFKRNEVKKSFHENTILDTIIQVNSKIEIPCSDNLLYLKMESDYTTAGELRRIFYRPSLVYMDLNYEDHTSGRCRLILPVMKSGVPINKKVLRDENALTFFSTGGAGNIDATSFVLSGSPRWVKNSFRIQIVEYIFEDSK
jgi:hypothetical protein